MRQGAEPSEWASWMDTLFAEPGEPECGDHWDDETMTLHVCARVTGHPYTHLSRDGWQWQR